MRYAGERVLGVGTEATLIQTTPQDPLLISMWREVVDLIHDRPKPLMLQLEECTVC